MEMLVVLGQPDLRIHFSLKCVMEILFSPKITNSPVILLPFPLGPVYTSAGAVIVKSIFKHGPHWQEVNSFVNLFLLLFHLCLFWQRK